MFKLFFRNILVLIVVAFIQNSIISSSLAETNITISPSIVEINAGRGGAKSFSLTVINGSLKEDVKCLIYSQDIEMKEDGNLDFLPKGNTSNTCSEWMKFNFEEVEVKAGSSEKIIVKLSVPPSTLPGGYYGAVIAEVVNKNKKLEKGVSIKWRLATIIKLTVMGGNLINKAEIDDLRFVIEENQDKLTFAVSLKNTGNIHFTTEGSLVIRNFDRKRKGQVSFDVGTGTILPGAVRQFKAEYPYFISSGEYFAEAQFKFGGYKVVKKEIPFSIGVGKSSEAQDQDVFFLSVLAIKTKELEVAAPKGSLRIQGLDVINRHDEQIKVRVKVEGDIDPNWIEFIPEEFTLKPLEKKNIKIKVLIPKESEPKKYEGKLVFIPGLVSNPDEIFGDSNVDLKIIVPNF